MKILCISDEVDPIVYSNNAKQRFSDVDIVLSAGDLPMEYLGFIASTLNKPILFVFGNHNLKRSGLYKKNAVDGPAFHNVYQKELANYFGSTYIGDKVKKVKDLIFLGLGGSMNYNGGENQFTDFQMYIKILRKIPRLLLNRLFFGRYCDILLTHAPSLGIHDKKDRCHTGFKAFRWFIKTFKPRYHLHGHIHIYDNRDERITKVDETTTINVFKHYVLDF